MAEFGSAVEAVCCAISIQEDLAVRNNERSADEQMWFRIGINVGDVLVANGDLFGNGVNVASRLEGLADPGGVCISGSTFDQVKNKLSIAFDDIGARSVKNIPEPIRAFRIVPGQVAVRSRGHPGDERKYGALSRQGRKWGALVVVAGIGILAGAAVIFMHNSVEEMIDHPFDGDWKVSVSDLKGCRDNTPRSFAIRVKNGRIDAQHLQFPKTGSISTDGMFRLKSTDRSGNLLNTQIGQISGDVGSGRFEGQTPTCTGVVTLVRLK